MIRVACRHENPEHAKFCPFTEVRAGAAAAPRGRE
jgi:hypothetical protein